MLPLFIVGFAYAVFIAIYAIRKRPIQRAHCVLSLLMLFLALPLLIHVFRIEFSEGVQRYHASLKSIPFLFGPLLYFYTRSVMDTNTTFKKRDLLHLLPFIIVTIIHSAVPFENIRPGLYGPPPGGPGPYLMEDNNRDFPIDPEGRGPIRPLPRGHRPPPGMYEPPGLPNPAMRPPRPAGQGAPGGRPSLQDRITGSLNLLSFIAYTVLILLLLRKHRKNISNYFSYHSMTINLQWLIWMTVSFVIAYTYVFITAMIAPEIPVPPFLRPHESQEIALVFFIFSFSFFAMRQPPIFNGTEQNGIEGKSGQKEDGPRYEKSGLRDEDAEKYLRTITAYMENEKPYCDGGLTIQELSEKLTIPKHYITQVINEKLGKNFYTFVNEYRIREVLAQIEGPQNKDYTILRLAYDAGFNSKSAFNAFFKKQMRMTPSEYRNLHASA